jgi:GT2 family glycosyltransferase
VERTVSIVVFGRASLSSGILKPIHNLALKAVGGFDEEYSLYFEDYALCRSICKHGKLGQLPNVKITHLDGNTARKGWRQVWMFSRSALRFITVG